MPIKNIRYYTATNRRVREDDYSELFYREFSRMNWDAFTSAIPEDKIDWTFLTKEERSIAAGGLILAKLYEHFIGSYCMPTILSGIDYTYSIRKGMIAGMINKLLSTHAIAFSSMLDSFVALEDLNDLWEIVINNKTFRDLFVHFKISIDSLGMFSNRRIMKEISFDAGEFILDEEDDTEYYHESLLKALIITTLLMETYYNIAAFILLDATKQNRFKNTREAFQLMIRDFTTMSVYLAALAAELAYKFDIAKQREIESWTAAKAETVRVMILSLVQDLGGGHSLQKQIGSYVEYNLNKTMYKLGYKDVFPTTEMPKTIERAIKIPINPRHYKFDYTDPEAKQTKWAVLMSHLRRIFK